MIQARNSLLVALAVSCLTTLGSLAADTLETLYTAPNRGAYPASGIHREPDGSFFVATTEGGSGGRGDVVKVSPAGEIQSLVSFYGLDGAFPVAGLTKAADGNFYGTTSSGGRRYAGTIFKMTPEGVTTTIAKFRGNNGVYPNSRLVEASNGLLYGTTDSGGTSGRGVVFSVSKTGTLTILVNFDGSNGAQPVGLTLGSDGNLYGVTREGGSQGTGTIFRVTPAGEFSSLASFSESVGARPFCALTEDTDGAFYGVTTEGGSGNYGTVFKFVPGSAITKVADFSYFETGASPHVALVRRAPGTFVGLTRFGGEIQNGTFFQVTSAGVITKLLELPTTVTGYATGSLIRGDGNIYYTSTRGGGSNGAGELLALDTAGTVSTIAAFGFNEGIRFVGDLALAPDGTFFGTTLYGGSQDRGVFFKITTAGAFEKLNDFTAQQFSGSSGSGVTLGTDGNFYGTTSFFGADGSLFRATPAGVLTNLANFGSPGGTQPLGVLQASDGALYGTTLSGGTDDKGVVFKYSEAQGLETLSNLATTSASNGAGRLIEASDGFFYGTTDQGGTDGLGSVIRVGSNGAVTVIASFKGANGAFPSGDLFEAEDGNFYGLVSQGGQVNAGGVFRVTPAGKLSLVASFRGFDGAFPFGGLVPGPRGELYGTASAGGQPGFGTVFRFSPKKKTINAVHHFPGGDGGAYPVGSLAVGNDYKLYGTTHNTIFRVNVVNSAPVAKDDTFDLPVFNVKPLKNDKDADKDDIRIVETGTPAHGDVIVHEDNTISYLPAETFTGEDTFSYTITDGFSEPVTAQITIRQPLNPLKAGAGAYGGLVLYQEGGIAGYWGIIATKQGLFTGALRLNGKKYTIRGIIVNGAFSVQVPLKGGEGTVTIQGTVDPGRNIAQGTISDGTRNYVLELYRTFPLFTRDQPTPAAGRYTVILPPDPSSTGNDALPQGNGYAIMNVTATGIVTISGKLGDGTPFSAGSLVTRDNTVPLYGEAYKSKGYIAGLIAFTPTPESDASAVELYWVKPETTKGLYQNGFITSPRLLASRYQKPAKKRTALSLGDSPETLRLSLEGLGITKDITLSIKNVVTVNNPDVDNVKLTINPKNGLFTGKYVAPVDDPDRVSGGVIGLPTATRQTFGGVLFQKSQSGAGTYVTGDSSGTVELSVRE